MRRYSYKVEFFPIDEIQVEKGLDKGRIEETLNSNAGKGWRLKETALCGEFGFICIFEKEEDRE